MTVTTPPAVLPVADALTAVETARLESAPVEPAPVLSVPPAFTAHRLSWPAEAGLAHVIRDAVHRWLTSLPIGAGAAASMVVAVDAAVENVVRHAYRTEPRGRVEIVCWTEAGAACVEVADTGLWREPNPNGRPGRGIPLMRQLVGSVTVQPQDQGTRVRFRHPIAAAA